MSYDRNELILEIICRSPSNELTVYYTNELTLQKRAHTTETSSHYRNEIILQKRAHTPETSLYSSNELIEYYQTYQNKFKIIFISTRGKKESNNNYTYKIMP